MIRKYKNEIIIFTSILTLVFINVLCMSVSSLDEIWKYSVSRAIHLGYTPYQDINIVTTPLYFMFYSLFYNIHDSLLMFRIVGSIMMTTTLFLLYLNIKHNTGVKFATIGTLFVTCFIPIFSKFSYTFDYNTVFLLIVLLLIYLHQTIKEKTTIYYFSFGFIIALAILTKQSAGCVLLLLYTLYFVFVEKILKERKFLEFAFGVFFPLCLFGINLIVNGTFDDFLNFCLFGLREFQKNNISIGSYLSNNPIFMILVGVTVCAFILHVARFIKTKNHISLLHIINLITLLTLCYPIFDENHFALSFIYSLFMFCSFLPTIESKLLQNKLQAIIFGVIGVLMVGFFVFHSLPFGKVVSTLPRFEGIPIDSDLQNSFSTLQTYINDKEDELGVDIVLISQDSAVYSILNDEYNGVYDLFLTGNLGVENENEPNYIEQLRNNGKYVLISQSYTSDNWQNEATTLNRVQSMFTEVETFYKYILYAPN